MEYLLKLLFLGAHFGEHCPAHLQMMAGTWVVVICVEAVIGWESQCRRHQRFPICSGHSVTTENECTQEWVIGLLTRLGLRWYAETTRGWSPRWECGEFGTLAINGSSQKARRRWLKCKLITFMLLAKPWESSQGLQQMQELWIWVRSYCLVGFFLPKCSIKNIFLVKMSRCSHSG